MRIHVRTSLLALAISPWLLASAYADDGVTLKGTIQADDTGRPIVGAKVELRELHRSTTTGRDGSYRFDNLAPGEYTLDISASGQSAIERHVTLNADRTSGNADIVLEVDGDHAVTLGETLVTAEDGPAAQARAMQKNAPNLILVQPAAEIEKLPDVNAGEAVRRLPGISLETDTGEGRFVNIRGIDADLNSTTFDGVRLLPTNTASPQGGGRAVAFDAIPSGLIGSITVTNTNIPEQDAEALGGTIDIKPKRLPDDKDYLLEAELGYGNENLRDTPVKDVQVTGGGRFGFGDSGDKPFSFIGTISYYSDQRGIDDIEAAYVDQQADGVPDKAFGEFDQRYYNYERRRHGYGGEFDYKPNDDNRWYIRYYDTGYTEQKSDQHLDISLFNQGNDPPNNYPNNPFFFNDPSNPNGFVDEGATFDKKLVDHREDIDSRVATIGGENVFSAFKLDYHAGFAIGSYQNDYNINTDFRSLDGAFGTVRYDNTTDPNHPRMIFSSGLNPLDPSQYILDSLTNDTGHDHEQEWSGAVNATVPTSDNENIKFGVSARLRNRNNEVTSFEADLPDDPLSLSNYITNQFVRYYAGLYTNGFNIDPNLMRGLYNSLPHSENIDDEELGFARGEEDIYAGYGQYQFEPMEKLGILTGVRYERTEATYEANSPFIDADGNTTYTLTKRDTSYDNFFPTIQARYEFEPDLIARAVYSKTIARPGFNQVSASTQVDAGAGTINTGNPDLKPINSDNFDLDIEYYLANGGILSAGVFHKQLSDYIVSTISRVDNPTTGPLAGFNGTVSTFGWENINHANATGVQLNYVEKFTDLPGILSGLGVNANYTYVDSRLQIRPGDYTLLPSTSKDTANLAVTYDYAGLSMNLAGYYTSKNIFAVGDANATDIWSQSRFSLDFGAIYAMNSWASVFFDAKNLTNTALKFTEGAGSNRPIQREYYNATLLAGIRVRL